MKSEINLALLKKDFKYLKDGVDDINKKLENIGKEFVNKIEFDLINKDQDKRIGQIEKLVFGATGLALITLGKAVLDLVVVTKATQ